MGGRRNARSAGTGGGRPRGRGRECVRWGPRYAGAGKMWALVARAPRGLGRRWRRLGMSHGGGEPPGNGAGGEGRGDGRGQGRGEGRRKRERGGGAGRTRQREVGGIDVGPGGGEEKPGEGELLREVRGTGAAAEGAARGPTLHRRRHGPLFLRSGARRACGRGRARPPTLPPPPLLLRCHPYRLWARARASASGTRRVSGGGGARVRATSRLACREPWALSAVR